MLIAKLLILSQFELSPSLRPSHLRQPAQQSAQALVLVRDYGRLLLIPITKRAAQQQHGQQTHKN